MLLLGILQRTFHFDGSNKESHACVHHLKPLVTLIDRKFKDVHHTDLDFSKSCLQNLVNSSSRITLLFERSFPQDTLHISLDPYDPYLETYSHFFQDY